MVGTIKSNCMSGPMKASMKGDEDDKIKKETCEYKL